MLSRLLDLKTGELPRLLPFFALYFVLLAAFTLADGLSLALLVQGGNGERFPVYYTTIALANFVLIAGYLSIVQRAGSVWTFQLILGGCSVSFLVFWIGVVCLESGRHWYGLPFVSREIAFTLLLMHFGTYLQDYFTREEMNRVLAIIYSGGRLGGIAGGFALEHLAGWLTLVDQMLLFAVLLGGCLGLVLVISRLCPKRRVPEDDRSDADVGCPEPDIERRAASSLTGFLRFAWQSPLLFWLTVTTVLFVMCRWLLNFQYNTFFAGYFANPVDMAAFLGRYTQMAMTLSLLIQLLLVNRLVGWIGIKGVYLVYAALVFVSMIAGVFGMTLAAAVLARLVEAELRFGLRNPVMQMITNKFSKAIRVRVRAWSMGFLIPAGTLVSSALLAGLVGGTAAWITWVGAAAALLYLAGSLVMCRSFAERKLRRWSAVAAPVFAPGDPALSTPATRR